ncbi:MAG TPA: BTAD domain-containing putative transcriptional regulator [Candidatus Acidoferrales bacterium]|nr:BTAD domain-containing putative transcriptional regulator [Candidatus Acidoferrales bacterium]
MAASPEVRRKRILARLERVRPKILVLVAPAGFGKSTVARQYLQGREAWGICDCAAVRSDVELGRRLLAALQAAFPKRRDAFVACERLLSDGSASVADRLRSVLEAWRELEAGTILFENAENLRTAPAVHALFAQLLASMPPGRSAVICTREPLRSHLTRFAAPHEIVALRAEELAFDAADVREIFAPDALDSETVEGVLAASRGWPIAVLLLRRFAAEGRIAALLNRLGDSAFEELHDYLVDEVLGTLGERLSAAVFACAAIPQATAADVEAALGGDSGIAELERFVRESPFASRGADGVFLLHPILATALIAGQQDRRIELLATVALRHEQSGAFERAAELHLARGDRDAAADALGRDRVSLEGSLTPSYARVLYALDRVRILQYPRLWTATCLRRMYRVDMAALLDEAESVWRMVSPTAPALDRCYVATLRVLMMSEMGRFEEADATIDECADVLAKVETELPVDAWFVYLRALVAARLGQLNGSEPILTAALPMVASMDLPAMETFLTLAVHVARPRGDRALERQFLARADDLARHSTLDNAVARVLSEIAFGAWLCGDAAVLEDLSPEAADSLRHVVYRHVVAAAQSPDDAEAVRDALAAAHAARECREPFVECLAELALALCDPSEFVEAIARARTAAMRCESAPLREAVEAIARREASCGFLTSFADRLTRARHETAAPVDVEFAGGTVRACGREVRLAGREAELLFALAARREPMARAHLAALLWPELDDDSARNALSVCLHRLRRSVGAAAIVREGEGYRLCDGARVDVWEIERTLAAMRSRGWLDEDARTALTRFATQLNAPSPARMERWEWFGAQGRRIEALRVDVTHRLGADALERGDAYAALTCANEILGRDPFDEPAREMAIRAHLAMDDRAAAMRSYRQYREILQSELQTEPSPHLTKILYS